MDANKGDLWRRDTTPGALVIVFGIGVTGFLLLALASIAVPGFVSFDEAFSGFVRSPDSSALDSVALWLTRIADLEVILSLTLGVALGLFMTKRRAEAALFLATVGLGTALGSLFKEVFQRLRPGLELARIPLPDSYSFPSGHALASFLFFGVLAFIVLLEAERLSTRAWVMVACGAMAIGIAFSRVYLGVHWFGDILASWMLGAAWMSVTVASYFWFTRRQLPPH